MACRGGCYGIVRARLHGCMAAGLALRECLHHGASPVPTPNSFFGSQSGDEATSAEEEALGVSILELEWPATLHCGPGCA